MVKIPYCYNPKSIADLNLKFESKKNSPTFASIKTRYGEEFSYCRVPCKGQDN